jgi:hypothetical protein
MKQLYEITPADNVLYFPNNIDVRICPKNGMSTLKEALRRMNGHTRPIGLRERVIMVRDHGYQFDLPFRKGSYRIAVRRDPIDRFKSACEFIQSARSYFIKNGRDLPCISLEIDRVIDDMESGNLKNTHFYTQSWYMGVPEDYDMVFHISEMDKLLDFLQEACNIERDVRKVHENKTTMKLYNDAISPEHMLKLRNFYSKDFKNGWCKQEDRLTF